MKNTRQRLRKLNSRQNPGGCRFGGDDRGFSLFTVMIAVSFIGILGMLLLYIALANFQMKTTDLRGKDSFYSAERALEEIRIGLQEDVGNAMSKAYITTMETYDENIQNSTSEATLDELRQSTFRQLYVKELAKELQASEEEKSLYSLKKLRKYVDLDSSTDFDESSETLLVTNPSGTEPLMVSSLKNGILLKNLKVIYVDKKGRASVIETDIRLGIPKTQYPTPSTLPDLMNMIVVADSGIVCESGAIGTSIQGSIYAGNIDRTDSVLTSNQIQDDTSILLENGAKLSVSGGDKVVCEGGISLPNGGSFKCERGVNLWAQGITLASANVSLQGKTYLADDLTVEANTATGGGSTVTIAGEYYGYGSVDSAKASKYNEGENARYKDMADAALNSAIVVNAKNATLDLAGVTRMMLAGRSYVGSRKVSGFTQGGNNYINQSNDVMTGESITVKGAQVAYLLPAKLLKAKDPDTELHNPMDYDEYLNKLADGDIKSILNMDVPVTEWGGRNLSEIGVDDTKPVTKVFYNQERNNGYVYFYLNFTDGQKASAFMAQYYQNNPEEKKKMDQYLSFYFPESNHGIRLNDSDSLLRFVTKGNVLTFDGETKTGEMKTATDIGGNPSLIQEQTNYQNMWFTLNRKMIGSYDLLKTEVKDADGVPHNEADPNRSVFDNLVNEKELVKFIQSQNFNGDWRYDYDAGEDNENLTAILYHNGASVSYQNSPTDTKMTNFSGANTELIIDADEAENLRLVVCTGDVRIESGVHFQGIIMAKGKITLGDGASLTSAPLDAAKVFQALNGEVEDSSKKLFWEGDRYVLGNTSTTDDTTTGKQSDTYDISQSIAYENWKKR